MKLILFQIFLFSFVWTVLSQTDFFKSVYKLYKGKRLPFREDPLLGNLPILKEYDFIVIGSGPGGATVSNRLTEVDKWKVLVLEAGKDGSVYTDIPASVSFLQFTDYNWGYKFQKQAGMCLGMVEQRCPLPRGKGVGGSSLINYMMYTRGRPKDYDRFEESGNPGWGFQDLLPYFLKSEKNNIAELKNSSEHSRKGYLNVEYVPYKSKFLDVFIEGHKELGYKEIDYNSAHEYQGVSRLQATLKSGRRVSAANAYLETAQHRSNLHVVEKARVTKILIDPFTKRALGVEFVKGRRRRAVFAKKEVILSAGAVNSPQLLMLSGIGPKEHLQNLGIQVVKDLPVGENLQDHFTTPIMMYLVNSTDTLNEVRAFSPESVHSWVTKGEGMLSSPGGVEGLSYISSKYNDDTEHPDLEIVQVSGSVVADGGKRIRETLGMTEEFYNSVYRPVDYRDSITIAPCLMRPKSKGRVTLKDRNPWHWPLVDLNYFNKTADLDVIVEGIKTVFELGETDAFRRSGAQLYSVPLPGCTDLDFGSDEYWACAVRTLPVTSYHQCCTNKMGPVSDPSAVVDPRLRVHGVSGLRVVDASIFPDIPTAHTYAPTVVVGEKAADMIKEDWLSSAQTFNSRFLNSF